MLIEQVVNALNAVSDRWGLIETGADVAALAARRRLGRHEITGQWRDW